jgi:hypothetical protein
MRRTLPLVQEILDFDPQRQYSSSDIAVEIG